MSKRTITIWSALLSVLGTMALTARLELYQGGGDNILESVLHRFYNTFQSGYLTDICVIVALFMLFKYVLSLDKKIDCFTAIFSLLLSVAYETSTFYAKYNSTKNMVINFYQVFTTVLFTVGFTVVIYAALKALLAITERLDFSIEKKPNFFEKHIWLMGAIIIFAGWSFWLFANYPGSTNPDAILQLQMYLKKATWSTWHPPLSTIIMGACFSLGRLIKDANLGYFLYCLLQTITGALIFGYGAKKLKEHGLRTLYCVIGIIFFAACPLWGAYAQWFEKDFLYTQMIVLQLIVMADIYLKKECTIKDFVRLLIASLLTVFLRNNGVFAVIPAMLVLGLLLSKLSRRFVLLAALITFTVYEAFVRAIFPLMGIEKTSVSETLGILFQQTARYVIEYPEEVTEAEKVILDVNFQGMEHLYNYDPRINDPVKIYYNHSDFKGYMGVWWSQFLRHPGVYFEAFFNGSYGYLAPVENEIGAWVQRDYFDYQKELGAYHPYDGVLVDVAIWSWNISQHVPILSYLTMPGFYTWVALILGWLSIKKRRASMLVLLLPSYINVLVCMASPLSNAMRYALPTVAAVPICLGVWACIMKKSEQVK